MTQHMALVDRLVGRAQLPVGEWRRREGLREPVAVDPCRDVEATKVRSHTRWLERQRLFGKCAQESMAMGQTTRLNVFASRG
jgi:hypothetical protein